MKPYDLMKHLCSGHVRHSLVNQKQRNPGVTNGELLRCFEPSRGRLGPHDPVVSAILRSEIALNGGEHGRIVVNGENDGLHRLRQNMLRVTVVESVTPD